ncbi:FAD-binding protein [Mailhella sp.]|uniref:FAD-binding protein n=1 Tax=Mailhella sp. TaxID=1981029 RepID=UPI003AB70340
MLKITQFFETDVLVVGGGIAGLMAGIAARDQGADVIIAEKADTRRSGSGATGNDHFLCYIPEKHGDDPRLVLHEIADSMLGSNMDADIAMRFLNESFNVVKSWHEWGINMRLHDDWTFMGHAFPGRPRIFLKYDGHNQKAVLTREAKKRGARLLNHHPVLELIKDENGVAGALALDVSSPEPAFTLIRAKTVILATGSGNRLYPSTSTPGMLFNTGFCPGCTAAALALSWRIGARLVNMEIPFRHAGPRYFTRCGKATWIGMYRYPDGKPLGPFVTKATRELGDITGDVWNTSFTDLMCNGRGPAYMDCTQDAPEDLAFMREGMASEGLTSLIDYMDANGIDPGKHVVEFGQFEPFLIGRGVEIDINGQSTIPGLYAAGDVMGNFRADMGGAAVMGWISGKEAAAACANRSLISAERAESDAWLNERLAYYGGFYERKQGAGWKDANMALQQIMNDYAAVGPHRVRSGSLLSAGLEYLRQLREQAVAQLSTSCSHTLMRATEVLDLMDCGEAVIRAAMERKESRGLHQRADFTFTNPLLNNKFLEIWREDGAVRMNWRSKRQ